MLSNSGRAERSAQARIQPAHLRRAQLARVATKPLRQQRRAVDHGRRQPAADAASFQLGRHFGVDQH
jgi:alkylhydroperoxidase family enzyme